MENAKTSFSWKSGKGEKRILNLKQLLDILIDIKQENIDVEISLNFSDLLEWIEKNYPKQISLIEHLKTESKEYTHQQIRERLIRDLRESLK